MSKSRTIIKSEAGFIYEAALVFIVLLVTAFFVSLFTINFQGSNERVSGIVYNTHNDTFIGGNTTFSIRAGENTPVTEENKSSYCLPAGSPYIALINKAAEDKTIKVAVEASKYFAFQAPWVCYPNVKVTLVK